VFLETASQFNKVGPITAFGNIVRMNRILVIGATGNVGRAVVAELPTTGVEVRALVRNPDTAGLPPHVEVVRGDLTIAESLEECLDGIHTVFLVWIAPPGAIAPAMEKILKQARRIVYLTAPYKTQHPFFQKPQPNPITAMHREIERLIESSGREWTFLRPHMLASNSRLWWAAQIRAGVDVIRWPYASAATAPTHERDIAAVAVRALCEDGHAGAEYVLTGPQSMTQSEQLSTLGEVIGRPLRMENISPDEARKLALFPEFVINLLMAAWEGAADQPAFMTSTVSEITGAPARTFREWAEDHSAEFLV
jgi:uncharacterized protein YbjT (DUF2867 family)